MISRTVSVTPLAPTFGVPFTDPIPALGELAAEAKLT
jgi:hypothetical protein